MFGKLQPDGRRIAALGNHVDATISIRTFSDQSCTSYSLHWLMLPPPRAINVDAARLGMYAHDLLQEGVFSFYVYHLLAPNPLIIYIQAPVFVSIWIQHCEYTGHHSGGRSLSHARDLLGCTLVLRGPRDNICPQSRADCSFGAGAFHILRISVPLRYRTPPSRRRSSCCGCVSVARFSTRGNSWTSFWPVFWSESASMYISQHVFFPVALAAAGVGAVLANRQLRGTLAWTDLGDSLCGACCFAPMDSFCHPSIYVFGARLESLRAYRGAVCF